MAANPRAASSMGVRGAGAGNAKKTYFEQQREVLIDEIAVSFEQVLANINKLNRSLEAVITVGNEFSSVEALWSQFEGVMGKEEERAADGEGEEEQEEEEAGHEVDDEHADDEQPGNEAIHEDEAHEEERAFSGPHGASHNRHGGEL